MKLSPIVTRLSARTNSFGDRVRGASEFSQFQDRSMKIITPHAFVMPQDIRAVATSVYRGPDPEIEETFVVAVAVGNRADIGGSGAIDDLDDLQAELITDLVGWAPDSDHTPLEFEGGELIGQDRNVLWYGFIFSTVQLGSIVFQGDLTAQLVMVEGAAVSTVRTAIATKLLADDPGGITWASATQHYLVGRELATNDQVTFSLAVQSPGVAQGGSNVDNRIAVAHLRLMYWPDTNPTTGTDNTAADKFADVLEEIQGLTYLNVTGVRQVTEPFRLSFPGDVVRHAG